jgi:hypothetical protein
MERFPLACDGYGPKAVIRAKRCPIAAVVDALDSQGIARGRHMRAFVLALRAQTTFANRQIAEESALKDERCP